MTKAQNTANFINKYLITEDIGKGFGLYRMMAESKGINQREVALKIRRMEYKDFLRTRYWQLVSLQAKHDAGWKCETCGRRYNLEAHHLDYTKHGYEMYHVDQLKCLCDRCHHQIHLAKTNKPS